MDTNCMRCGRKVKREENWLRVHLWGNIAVLHWACFIGWAKANEADLERKAAIGK